MTTSERREPDRTRRTASTTPMTRTRPHVHRRPATHQLRGTVEAVLRRQAGVVSRAQALRAGLTAREIDRLVARRRWVPRASARLPRRGVPAHRRGARPGGRALGGGRGGARRARGRCGGTACCPARRDGDAHRAAPLPGPAAGRRRAPAGPPRERRGHAARASPCPSARWRCSTRPSRRERAAPRCSAPCGAHARPRRAAGRRGDAIGAAVRPPPAACSRDVSCTPPRTCAECGASRNRYS